MGSTIVSRDYRITITKDVREQLGIRPGQKLEVYVEDGILRMAPVPLSDGPTTG